MDRSYKVWLIYGSSSSKVCVLEFDLEYPKELCGMHNNCPSEKIEIKREISGYQLKIAGEYNILIGNITNSFDKKSMCFIMKTYNFNAKIKI